MIVLRFSFHLNFQLISTKSQLIHSFHVGSVLRIVDRRNARRENEREREREREREIISNGERKRKEREGKEKKTNHAERTKSPMKRVSR